MSSGLVARVRVGFAKTAVCAWKRMGCPMIKTGDSFGWIMTLLSMNVTIVAAVALIALTVSFSEAERFPWRYSKRRRKDGVRAHTVSSVDMP